MPEPVKRWPLLLLLVVAAACGEPEAPGVGRTSIDFGPQESLSLEPSDGFRDFGYAVALGADRAWVGARADEAGAVYPFTAGDDGPWTPGTPLRPVNAAGSRFGAAMAADGDALAVGAPFDPAAGDRAGTVHLYRADGTDPAARLQGDAPLGYFGSAVDVRGGALAVGAPGPGASSAYVYERGDTDWTRVAELPGPDDRLLRFGASVSLADGTLAVGAWTEAPTNGGRAFVYEGTESGWERAAELAPPEPGPGAGGPDADFGRALALAEDRLAVAGTRAVYLFEREAGTWTLVTTLSAPLDEPRFGASLTWASRTLFVGAPASSPREGEAAEVGGRVYAYRQDPAGWHEAGHLTHPRVGFGEALDADAGRLLVGAGEGGRSDTALLFPWDGLP